jgi:hypothetical protein
LLIHVDLFFPTRDVARPTLAIGHAVQRTRTRCRARRVALRHGPRFDEVCPDFLAADPQSTNRNAGTFITAMFMSGRLPSASGIRTTPIRGN